MYSTRQTSRSEFVAIRQLNYHVRLWGPETSPLPPLVLVHGWMDVAASYQFVVDALGGDFLRGRRIIAPDWRGFGLTAPPVPTDHYFFPDYLADLDQLLDHYAPGTPVDLVGHSMGGNVVMFYAGARPLKKTNPPLTQEKAGWLATPWARPNAQGQWEILGDAAHKIVNAQLFRLDEVLALYAAITAPTLAVEASDDSLGLWWKGRYTLDEYHERLKAVPDCRTAVVQDAGHMLHHDQPQAVAALIESFLA